MQTIAETHTTILEIKKHALRHNLQLLRKKVEPSSSKIMAMVKANGYGHGLITMAQLLEQEKIDFLGVAFSDSGVQLRTNNISTPIVVMDTEREGFEHIIQYNLQPVFFNFSLLKDFLSLLKQKNITRFPIHIEIETGMHRLGFEEHQWIELINFINNKDHKKHLFIQSFFSHLAASDEIHHDNFTWQQATKFDQFLQLCDAHHVEKTYFTHIANSGAALRFSGLQKNIVRIGVSLLGIELTNPPVGLKRISSLKTTIAQIKHIKKGETIGYSRKGVAGEDMTIATIRIGYADGFSRGFNNGIGKVFLHNKLAPVVGSVCMDMTMIDISQIPETKEEDVVEIFGEHILVETLAETLQTIPYEIFTGIAPRVKKVII